MSVPSQNTFALGPIQTNYQTEVAPSSSPENYRMIAKEGYDPAAFVSPNAVDDGYATGAAYGRRVSKGRDDVTWTASERATFEGLGFHAVTAMGNYAAPSSPVTGVYVHTFTLLDPHVSRVLPVRPLAEKFGEPALVGNVIHDVKYSSMQHESWAFAMNGGPAGSSLMQTSTFRGSGKRTAPSGVQFFGTGKHVVLDDEMSENFVQSTSGVIKLYNAASLGGTETLPGCDFADWNFTINNATNADAGYQGCALFQEGNPALGAIRGKNAVTAQTLDSSFTLVLSPSLVTNFAPETLFKVGTAFSLQSVFNGPQIGATIYNHRATFTLNRAVIADVDFPEVNGEQGVAITVAPLAVGNTMPLTLEIVSDVANFNTYVG